MNATPSRVAAASGGDVVEGHARSAHAKMASSSKLPAVPSSGSAESTPHATSRTSCAEAVVVGVVGGAGVGVGGAVDGSAVDASASPPACFSFAPGLAPSNPEFFEKKRILEKIAAATSAGAAPLDPLSAATMAGATPVLSLVDEVSPAATARRTPAATHCGDGREMLARATATHSLVVAAAAVETAAACPASAYRVASVEHASAAATAA